MRGGWVTRRLWGEPPAWGGDSTGDQGEKPLREPLGGASGGSRLPGRGGLHSEVKWEKPLRELLEELPARWGEQYSTVRSRGGSLWGEPSAVGRLHSQVKRRSL